MHEVLVNRLGGLSLPRKSVVRLTDRLDMTLDVYRGRKTTMQLAMNYSMYDSLSKKKKKMGKEKEERTKERKRVLYLSSNFEPSTTSSKPNEA